MLCLVRCVGPSQPTKRLDTDWLAGYWQSLHLVILWETTLAPVWRLFRTEKRAGTDAVRRL